MTLGKEAKDPSRCPCATLKVRPPRQMVLLHGACTQSWCFKGKHLHQTLLIFCISVHPSDPTRLELIIPGEQHFYVRAVNAAERQRWLVALGSSKAGTLDSHKHRGTHSFYINLSVCVSSTFWSSVWWKITFKQIDTHCKTVWQTFTNIVCSTVKVIFARAAHYNNQGERNGFRFLYFSLSTTKAQSC